MRLTLAFFNRLGQLHGLLIAHGHYLIGHAHDACGQCRGTGQSGPGFSGVRRSACSGPRSAQAGDIHAAGHFSHFFVRILIHCGNRFVDNCSDQDTQHFQIIRVYGFGLDLDGGHFVPPVMVTVTISPLAVPVYSRASSSSCFRADLILHFLDLTHHCLRVQGGHSLWEVLLS